MFQPSYPLFFFYRWSDGLLSHDKDDVVDRVAYLEKKLQTQEDEIVCLKSAMADVIRRLASVENSEFLEIVHCLDY